MKRKKKQPQQSAQPGLQKRKISEMIQEFAGDFIRLGKTPEDKQNCLNGACVAWNIASAPPERRKKLVDHFLADYMRHNPNTDEAALAAIRSDMEYLIEVKLKMFPYDLRQIVSAEYIHTEHRDRIEVASARLWRSQHVQPEIRRGRPAWLRPVRRSRRRGRGSNSIGFSTNQVLHLQEDQAGRPGDGRSPPA